MATSGRRNASRLKKLEQAQADKPGRCPACGKDDRTITVIEITFPPGTDPSRLKADPPASLCEHCGRPKQIRYVERIREETVESLTRTVDEQGRQLAFDPFCCP